MSSYICQHVSVAIAFAYNTLGEILGKCGTEESKSKSCPPSTDMKNRSGE